MLRYSADIRTVITVACYFCLVAIQWLWTPTSVWISVALVVVTCANSFLVAVATHNAVHVPVFKDRWMNRVFQVILTLGYGHPVSAFVPGHNLSHHRYMQTPKDAMRTSKLRFSWHLLNLLLLPVLVGGAIYRGNANYFKEMRTRNPRWFRQFTVEAGVYAVVVVTLLFLDPTKWFFTVLIPHQYAAWGIMAMNMIQHDGCDETSEWNHSRNFVGPIINFFCFNNGYHSIHHRHIGLHWSLTPEAHRREFGPHIHPDLEQQNFLVWILRTFVLPGGRRTYDGRPVVLGPLEPDEDWVANLQEVPEELGALA